LTFKAAIMIVFIAGMQRSGSTFTFNIARELLQQHGTVYQEPSDDLVAVINRSGDADHIIIKAHASNDFLSALARQKVISTICSVRNLDEAIASWMSTFGFDLETTLTQFKGWFDAYRKVRPYALTVPYSLIENDTLAVTTLIARHIFPETDVATIAALAEKYSKDNVHRMSATMEKSPDVRDIGFSFYDVKTFFHRRHVASLTPRKPKEQLSEVELARICQEFRSEITLLDEVLAGFGRPL
jgi:hypothetical protein